MTTTHIIKINLPGGFISAGDLYEILVIAETAGAQNVRFGNRQQMYFTINADQLDDMELDMLRAGIIYEVDANVYQNMISSYVGDGIFSIESWMREGVYKDVFDSFNYQPKLKINIVDRHQAFVHFFSGNFNFISADISNYWYLYVRFPRTSQFYCWPSLVYTDDICLISKKAEEVILNHKAHFYDKPNINEALFFEKVTEGIDLPPQTIAHKLELPDFQLPYYEGFNKYANNKYWLGVYRRTEQFGIDFLKDVCNLCLKTRIGQLYTTPWKSVLIKGIDPGNRNNWGQILDKYRLNVRHASNELNWQTEDLCDEGLMLKQQLVREFEEADLRTYRLSFAIKTQPKTGLPGSIVIKAHPSGGYEILHTADFNPNSKSYISYKSRIKRADLGKHLINLCNHYYNHLTPQNSIIDAVVTDAPQAEAVSRALYECKFCKTIYDSTYGDTANNIPAGTHFNEVSAGYRCPVCEADKNYFELSYKKLVIAYMNKLEAAFELFDAYNKQDPRTLLWNGLAYPQEYFFAIKLYGWVLQLDLDASEELRLAARSQHIGRWEIPRESYPDGRDAYLKWRKDLALHHAAIASALMAEAGYAAQPTERVKQIVLKQRIKADPDVQTMENALCLVFLEFQYEDFLKKYEQEPEKLINILRRSLLKMDLHGHSFALKLSYSDVGLHLIKEAIKQLK